MTHTPYDHTYEPGVNLEYGMPACWEDMERLGVDPLTGEPVACGTCHDYITAGRPCTDCGVT